MAKSRDKLRTFFNILDQLIAHQEYGVTASEIGEAIGVTRQIVTPYLTHILPEQGIIVENVAHGRYRVDPSTLRFERMHRNQQWFLYMGLRKLIRSNIDFFPSVRSVIERLLSQLDTDIADHFKRLSLASEQDKNIFEILVLGQREQQKVNITYKAPNEDAKSFLVSPYWFEPSPWSDALYMICGTEFNSDSKFASLKLQRIHSAILTSYYFDPPNTASLIEEVDKAWGAWFGDGYDIKLRFSPRVQERLQETQWVWYEHIETDEQGYVIWRATVSEYQEMIPWIRGWGSDVEVLEPQDLRVVIQADLLQAIKNYGLDTNYPRKFY